MFDFIKSNKFYSAKDTMKKMKTQPTEWGKKSLQKIHILKRTSTFKTQHPLKSGYKV